MGSRYNMVDIGIEGLLGRTVLSAKINKERDMVVLETTTGPLYLTWEGDCCSACYLVHISGAACLIGTVTGAENSNWCVLSEDEENSIVEESMGTTIKTDKGYVTFEMRLEHNGYYGGSILVCEEGPMDQYHSPRGEYDPATLTPITEF